MLPSVSLERLTKRQAQRPLISNHHGNMSNQNNLRAAIPLIENHKEIDIVEVDFVQYNQELISSHDYDAPGILNGSRLEDWLDFVVIDQRRILWIDMKARYDVVGFLFANKQETAQLLFEKLRRTRATYLRKMSDSDSAIDLEQWVMITSQDATLNEWIRFYGGNSETGDSWTIVADAPFGWSYFFKWYMPNEFQDWVDDYVYRYFTEEYDFRGDSIVSVDISFFGNSMKRVHDFLKHTNIRPDTFVVLYNFKEGTKPIRLEGYNVITQYDYYADSAL